MVQTTDSLYRRRAVRLGCGLQRAGEHTARAADNHGAYLQGDYITSSKAGIAASS